MSPNRQASIGAGELDPCRYGRGSPQESAFEDERAALQGQEAHLNQRIRSLLEARPSQPISPAMDDIQEELTSLTVAHSTLQTTVHSLKKEVQDLRAANRILAEENEGWEYLVRERTLTGKMGGGVFDLGSDANAAEEETVREGKSVLERLDEELEEDIGRGEGDKSMGGPGSTSPGQGGPLSSSPRPMPAGRRCTRDGASKAAPSMNLATELDMAGEPTARGEPANRSE